jgi:predicted dehydrogenase
LSTPGRTGSRKAWCVSTPTQLYGEILTGAVTHAVLVDKPVTTTYEEAKELGMIAQKKNLILYAFQNRRWDSDYLTLRKILEKGTLGHITDFVSQYVSPFPSGSLAHLIDD